MKPPLTPRQMQLGAYISSLFADGVIKKRADYKDTLAAIVKALEKDMAAVWHLVGSEAVKRAARSYLGGLLDKLVDKMTRG